MNSSTVIFILALPFILITTVTCQSSSACSEHFIQKTENYSLAYCKKLATLGAEFAWNYSDIHHVSRIDILIGARLHAEMGWLAWGVNPLDMPQMVGTRAIIGIMLPNGTTVVDTYNITADTKLGCRLQPSKLDDITVWNKSIDYDDRSGYLTISATLFLPSLYNISKLNHVWQVGYDVDNWEPKMHPATLQNVDSTESINLKTSESQGVGKHRRHLRIVHGILNILGWGTFLPIGVIYARYCKVHPLKFRTWFIFHVSCQIIGYILGTVGWSIGLWLGHASAHYNFRIHRMMAIFIFTFTTLQMLALRFRPKPRDEYRKFWNIYHHFLGYALIAVIAINIFHGIAILEPDHTWKWAYIGILGILGTITLSLEIYSWVKFLRNKSKPQNTTSGPDKSSQQNKTTPGPNAGGDAQDASTSTQGGRVGGPPGGRGAGGGGRP